VSPSFRVIPWWSAVLCAIAIMVSASATIAILLSIAHNRPALEIEAIKVGLSVGAGVAGAAALLLAFRRQWLNEHVAKDTAFDATERRVTEIFTKAVEQLGHAQAAVRLGGVYALERLAEGFPEYRRTVVDVICAYLRMSVVLPPPNGPQSHDLDDDDEFWKVDVAALRDTYGEELPVRLAAQGVLSRHLRDPGTIGSHRNEKSLPRATYWGALDIDLTGAHLINCDFRDCQFGRTEFSDARFTGNALFFAANFAGFASFEGAEFFGRAMCANAVFMDSAAFSKAVFHSMAGFQQCHFQSDYNWFNRASFLSYASFSEATLLGADFHDARFEGEADFAGAHLGKTTLDGAIFEKGNNLKKHRRKRTN
jgi:hypothetical protein